MVACGAGRPSPWFLRALYTPLVHRSRSAGQRLLRADVLGSPAAGAQEPSCQDLQQHTCYRYVGGRQWPPHDPDMPHRKALPGAKRPSTASAERGDNGMPRMAPARHCVRRLRRSKDTCTWSQQLRASCPGPPGTYRTCPPAPCAKECEQPGRTWPVQLSRSCPAAAQNASHHWRDGRNPREVRPTPQYPRLVGEHSSRQLRRRQGGA
jgi:hypothetical protein